MAERINTSVFNWTSNTGTEAAKSSTVAEGKQRGCTRTTSSCGQTTPYDSSRCQQVNTWNTIVSGDMSSKTNIDIVFIHLC